MKNLFGKTKTSDEPIKYKVFGVPLEEVCANDDKEIPIITSEAMEFLEQKGLEVEGIFRIPGNSEYVDKLKAYYDGEPDDMHLENCDDVHAVAGLLKLYLRELPDPLLTHHFYQTFIAVQKNPDPMYRMTNIRKLVNALPPAHKTLLTRLCEFLIRVATFSEKNKMNEANLAIVFGPNLLRPENESMITMIQDARHVNGVIRSLLEEFEFLVACTTTQPKYKENREQLRDASPLKIAVCSSSKTNTSSPGYKRRAFKFEVDTAEGLTSNTNASEILPPPESPRKSDDNHITDNSPLEYLQFDLDAPLEYAKAKIKEAADESGRPWEISLMTPKQQIEEKVIVKRQLRNFDLAFKAKFGFMPAKKDKEPLRLLYQRYRDLSRIVEKLDNFTDPENVILSLEENPEYKLLKKEKRQLQFFLHEYQAAFINQHGRRIQYVQDREPVQKEYERYKELKAMIVAMEEKYKKTAQDNTS